MSCGDSSTLLKDTGLTNQGFFFFLYEPRNEYLCYPPSPKTGSLTSGQMFSEKGPERNISGFAGHSVSVTATQLCHFSAEAAIDDT